MHFRSVRRAGTAACTGVVVALGLLVAGAPAQAGVDRATAAGPAPQQSTQAKPARFRSYYVSPTGDDAASGSSTDPWRSLARASRAALAPGDRVLLRRGATYAGTLRIAVSGTRARPVRIASYGTGALPTITGGCVRLDGSWLVLSQVRTLDCDWAGISISGDHVVVSGNTTQHNVTGIFIRPGADHAQVIGNRVVDNNRMSVDTPGGDDDSGAFGILVHGDHSRIAWNQISGSHAMSHDYGMDGSAVEIYGAIGTDVDHNVSRDNNTFSELGNPRTNGTTYAFNVVTTAQDDASFLITRGSGSHWGPVRNTLAVHNSVLLTGARSQGFVCYAGCSPAILGLRANVISAVWKAGYADGPLAGGGNLYGGGIRQFTMLPKDTVGNPRFVNPSTGNLNLQGGSPAIDRGVPTGYTVDVAHAKMPRDGNGDGIARADIGALERQPARPHRHVRHHRR